MLARIKNNLFLRSVLLVVVSLFIFSNFAIADVISSSHLRQPTTQVEQNKGDNLGDDLDIARLRENPPQDGSLIPIKQGKGLFLLKMMILIIKMMLIYHNNWTNLESMMSFQITMLIFKIMIF